MYKFDLYCNLPNEKIEREEYINQVIDISIAADRSGFDGVLLHFNHEMIDPYILASFIIQHTKSLSPIIAVQPNYAAPVSVAKKIQSLSYLYNRRVILNMITGSADREFGQLNDTLPHDERYERLKEYIEVLKQLLSQETATTYAGQYYNYSKVILSPSIHPKLKPEYFISGSSSKSIDLAMQQGDVFMMHPEPIDLFSKQVECIRGRVRLGVKVGIIARETAEKAWEDAVRKYPPSKMGKVMLTMKKKSESQWLKNIAELGSEKACYDGVYWLGGFISGLANNPILVGDFEQVTEYLASYLNVGVTAIIVSGALSDEDFNCVGQVISKLRGV